MPYAKVPSRNRSRYFVSSNGPAAELCRKLGVNETTFSAWKKKYAGMGIAELWRVFSSEPFAAARLFER
jgi:Transposase.